MFGIDDYVVTRSPFAERFRRGKPVPAQDRQRGLCIYMREGIRAWIQPAEEELKNAEHLLYGGFYRGM